MGGRMRGLIGGWISGWIDEKITISGDGWSRDEVMDEREITNLFKCNCLGIL